MTKIVYAPLKAARSGKKATSVATKRLKNADGSIVTVYTVDADSVTFADDLSYAFRQNVRRARRRHKALQTANPATVARSGRVTAKS